MRIGALFLWPTLWGPLPARKLKKNYETWKLQTRIFIINFRFRKWNKKLYVPFSNPITNSKNKKINWSRVRFSDPLWVILWVFKWILSFVIIYQKNFHNIFALNSNLHIRLQTFSHLINSREKKIKLPINSSFYIKLNHLSIIRVTT